MTDRIRRRITEARVEAVERLLDIAYGGDKAHGYSAGLVLERGAVRLVVSDAMCSAHMPGPSGTTCGRCLRPNGGHPDPGILAEIEALSDIAAGNVGAVLDAIGGMPDAAPAPVPTDDILDALDNFTL